MPNPRNTTAFIVALLLIVPLSAAQGANVFVPLMDVTSRVDMQGEVETRGQFRISFDGGYKYQARLSFQYYNLHIEEDSSPSLLFDGAQATINDIFTFMDLTYWTGFYGILGEGAHYKGYLYHMDESGFDYDGYLPVVGTGMVLGADFSSVYRGQLFVYQRYGSGWINSVDLTLGLNGDPLCFTLFLGASDQTYRAAAQIQYLGREVELYLTVGDPAIQSLNSLSYDDLYFLLEEWFLMKNWNLILSVFMRPDNHYNYELREFVDTNEENDIDFNFDLNYGPEEHNYTVGGELNIRTNELETLGVSLSPYISVATFGVVWKIKIDFNVLSETRDLLSGYLNIQASF